MTAQYAEILEYEGETYSMASTPLYTYLKGNDLIPDPFGNTACYRGYVGRWKLEDDQLYFLNFEYLSRASYHIGLDKLWQNMNEVFAYWFTGEIKLETGELLHYIHSGFASIYEKDIFLEFEMGRLISRREVDNHERYEELKKKGLLH